MRRTTVGTMGPMNSFSACMTSKKKLKKSQLKFGTHKFERVQWNRINPFENNLWSQAPISPSGHHGALQFPHRYIKSV